MRLFSIHSQSNAITNHPLAGAGAVSASRPAGHAAPRRARPCPARALGCTWPRAPRRSTRRALRRGSSLSKSVSKTRTCKPHFRKASSRTDTHVTLSSTSGGPNSQGRFSLTVSSSHSHHEIEHSAPMSLEVMSFMCARIFSSGQSHHFRVSNFSTVSSSKRRPTSRAGLPRTMA